MLNVVQVSLLHLLLLNPSQRTPLIPPHPLLWHHRHLQLRLHLLLQLNLQALGHLHLRPQQALPRQQASQLAMPPLDLLALPMTLHQGQLSQMMLAVSTGSLASCSGCHQILLR